MLNFRSSFRYQEQLFELVDFKYSYPVLCSFRTWLICVILPSGVNIQKEYYLREEGWSMKVLPGQSRKIFQ